MPYRRNNFSFILFPLPAFLLLLAWPTNLPRSCCASGLSGNNNKLRVSRKYPCLDGHQPAKVGTARRRGAEDGQPELTDDASDAHRGVKDKSADEACGSRAEGIEQDMQGEQCGQGTVQG